MMKFKGEEFYNPKKATWAFIEKLVYSLAAEGVPPDKIDLELGPPSIMDNRTASNWLLANYLEATDFYPGRPPAIAEVGGIFRDSDGRRVMETPVDCFRNAQAVFSELRQVEDEYREMYDSAYRGRASRSEDCLHIRLEGRLGEFAGKIVDRYGYESSLPVIIDGLWKIQTVGMPMAVVITALALKGDGNPVFHTHPGNDHWNHCAFSGNDFRHCMNEPVLRSGESENYVMHVPAYAMRRISAFLPEDHAAKSDEKTDLMLRNRGFLDEPVERDLLGVRYVWRPSKRSLLVSPVVSEIHYNALRGKVPEGVDMCVKGFYINDNGASMPFDPLNCRR